MTIEEQLAQAKKDLETAKGALTPLQSQLTTLKGQVDGFNGKFDVVNAEKKTLLEKLKIIETADLEKTNNFKTLWENEKTRADNERTRADEATATSKKTQKAFFETIKLSKIESEASKLGIEEKYLSFLTSSESKNVITETTSTGSINVIGAKEFAEEFKVNFPKMFKDDAAPNVNNGGGGTGGDKNKKGSELSGDDLLAMQEKDPELYNKTMKELM